MNTKKCLNCNLESDAQFCPSCGQSKAVKLSSIWHLISDTFDIIYNLDSKVWQSIGPLVFKPGKLTNEYIAGRRVRYLPPFRLYLIFSIFFFLVAAIPEFTGFDELDQDELEEIAQDLQDSQAAINDLITEEISLIGQNLPGQEVIITEEDLDPNSIANGPGVLPPAIIPPTELFQLDFGGDTPVLSEADDCVNVPWEQFLGERLGARALSSCQTAFSDNGVTLIQSFTANLPIMMFFCVPLLAVFMKFLYIFKKRKYVEHLMFLFHTHSFIFAIAIITIFIVRLSEPFPIIENYMALSISALWIYAAIYVFIALRRVYRQGRIMSSIKILFLIPSYTICLAITFASGMILTFITI